MSDPGYLLEETSPYGSLEALVEDDGRTVYLYLRRLGAAEPEMRPVWVANRLPAPGEADLAALREGIAPLMPRAGTRHPRGHPPIPAGELSLVWFEEGDGAALLRGGTPIAVVPSWAGIGGFAGYAAEAVGVQMLAWELAPALETLSARIEASRRYWEWRASDASWERIRDGGLGHLERRLGPHHRYFAADGGRFPPRAVSLHRPAEPGGIAFYCTVGMSAQAMPQVEMAPGAPRRIELALAARGESERHAQLLSDLMEIPWRELTWLGTGHTCAWADPAAPPVILLASPPPVTTGRWPLTRKTRPPDLSGLLDGEGAPVPFLWVVPITPAEQARAEAEGSDTIVRELERQGRGWIWENR